MSVCQPRMLKWKLHFTFNMWAHGGRMTVWPCLISMTSRSMNACFWGFCWQWEKTCKGSKVCMWGCVWRDFLRDNKEWEWEGKTWWWGQLGTVCSKPSRQTESGEGVSVDCTSLLWFIRLLSLTLVGVNGGCHACTLALLLSSCLGNGASPPGPKFGISILCSNGPPFATCQCKIGGFVPARAPPAERGPVFLSCSMTPLFLTVDFLSLSSLAAPFILFHQSSSSPRGRWKDIEYNHKPSETGSPGYPLLSNRRFFPN